MLRFTVQKTGFKKQETRTSSYMKLHFTIFFEFCLRFSRLIFLPL